MSVVVLILALFIFYPVLTFYRDERRDNAIQGSVRVNAVGTLLLTCVLSSRAYFERLPQDKPLFYSECQNRLTRRRRKKHVLALDLMGTSTN